MPKKKNEDVVNKVKEGVKKLSKKGEIKFLQNLYTDFKSTLGEGLGDAGNLIKKHKLLAIIAFLGFLYYRNKQFTIGQFVQKLEDRLSKKHEEGW